MFMTDISQINRNIVFNKVQYGGRTEEDQVFYDLMARVINVSFPKTLFGPEILKENDPDFIRKALVPPFLKLRQKLPRIYNMLIKKSFFDFHIKIIEYNDKSFSHHDSDGEEYRARASYQPKYWECGFIYVNKFGNFDTDLYNEAIYHEIMHILVDLAVKDNSNGHYTICDCLNAKYPNQLISLVESFPKKLAKAEKKFVEWLKSLKSLPPDSVLYNKYISINEECGFWTYKSIKKNESFKDYLKKNNYTFIDNERELLVVALTLFFGSDEEHNRLKNQERWLYDRINNEVRVIINKAPLTLEEAQVLINK